MGPPIVIEAGLFVPVKEPVPVPVQLTKWKPRLALALIETCFPAFCQPLAGVTVPPLPAVMVRKYCVVKVAVKVALLVGETVCEIAPRSLQFFQTYCTPGPPL